ncbi:MAG: hypothetical protein H0T48_05680 [Gemmatimonadaceae bacterium]|nr:hypothetical protein [Gemmatimonadaceae bacterium]
MTDHSMEPGRIDLRAIDEPEDALQADRIIAAALARSRGGPNQPRLDALESLSGYLRPMLAIAASLLIVATGTVIALGPPEPSSQPVAILAEWTESQHVPTNGELLVAFQGYGR